MHLRLQASTPCNQLYTIFLFFESPQSLCHAPPGAQQLARPDLLNVPHFGHILVAGVTPGVVRDAMACVLALCHRASHRWGDNAWHIGRDIDPDDPSNISLLVAFELTQLRPQSLCLNDPALLNIWSMLATRETFHLEISLSNKIAFLNMWSILVTLETFHFERSLLNDVAFWKI